MHNRKKSDHIVTRSEKEIAILKKKYDAYDALVTTLFDRRNRKEYNNETLILTKKVRPIVFYTNEM